MFALHLQNHIQKNRIRRDGSRTAATSEMELVVIIVNGFQPYLGCCSCPRSASESYIQTCETKMKSQSLVKQCFRASPKKVMIGLDN